MGKVFKALADAKSAWSFLQTQSCPVRDRPKPLTDSATPLPPLHGQGSTSNLAGRRSIKLYVHNVSRGLVLLLHSWRDGEASKCEYTI